MAHYYATPCSSTKKAAGSQPQFSMALELYIDKPKVRYSLSCCIYCFHILYSFCFGAGALSVRRQQLFESAVQHLQRSITLSTSVMLSSILVSLNSFELCVFLLQSGGRIESTFVQTSHTNNSAVDASTVIQLKKAHTICNPETGEVEIEWPENAHVCEGILGKDVFASGATKNVYKVLSAYSLRL